MVFIRRGWTGSFLTGPFNQDIRAWNTSRVTTMRSMFQTALVFNQDIGKWNTLNVTDMSRQFNNALAFNQDIGKWDTSNVTNMELMFEFTLAFNQNLGSWNIASVQFLDGMFAEYTGLSTANYSALLIGFAGQPVHRNLRLSANAHYSAGAAATARASLIANSGWTIDDAGQAP